MGLEDPSPDFFELKVEEAERKATKRLRHVFYVSPAAAQVLREQGYEIGDLIVEYDTRPILER